MLDDGLPCVQALSMEDEDAEMAKALAKSEEEYSQKNQLREGGNQLSCIFYKSAHCGRYTMAVSLSKPVQRL